MAESARQKRMRELGIVSSPSTPISPSNELAVSDAAELSPREKRKMDLGVIPDTRKKAEPIQFNPIKNNIMDYPGMQQFGQPTEQVIAENKPSLAQRILGFDTKEFPEYTKQREESQAKVRSIPVIGSALQTADKFSDTKVQNVIADVGQTLYTPGAGMANTIGFASSAGAAITKTFPKLASTFGGRAAKGAIQSAVTDAPIAAGNALARGETDLREVAKQGAIGGAAGLVLGGVAPYAGEFFKKIAGSKVGDSFNSFINRSKTAEVPAAPIETPIFDKPQRLKVANAEKTLDTVMGKIKPIVTENITPPLENPGELAKWVRTNLGGDISLNEVRKVPYEDLRQMAEMMRSSMNVAEEATKAARVRGYNLPNLLDGKGPSLSARQALDESKRVAGIYPEPIPIKKPNFAPTIPTASAEPTKQNWFNNLFGNQGVGISAFGSAKQISKDPLTTAGQLVKNPLKNDVQGLKEQVKATGRATYQNFVDVNRPLKHISKETYEKSMDASRANNIANTIVSDKFVNPQGEVIGEGLTNTFKKVGRGQTKQFLDYLVLRHAKTRMERGERVYTENLGMTPERAQERIDAYNKQNPEFADIAKEWDKFNENTLQTYGVDEGLMTPEMFTTLREQNPNYASMRRQFSTSEKFASPFSMGAKPSFSGQKAPIREVSPTGSVRRIVDPRRSAVEATGAWVNAAMRNRVMTSIVDKVKVDPAGMKGIVEIVQAPKGQRDLAEVLSTDGAEGFLESLDGDFNALFSRTALDKDNIVRAMVKGQPVYMKVVNPEAVKALIGMGAEQSNIVMDVFGKLSNATKYGATGALAPLFAVKGLTTDIAQAIIQSKNPAAHLWDLGHAMISSIADTLPKGMKGAETIRGLAQDYRRSGGEFSAALKGNRPLNTSVRKMDRNPLLSPQAITRGLGQTIAAPFKALNKVSDIAENLNRMAGAKGELRRLGGERTSDNVMKAMSQGREGTTNFFRKGSKSQNIEKFIPYSNAAIQGIYRFAKAWKQNPVKTAALVGGAVMVPKAIEYFQFHDDPDYQNIPAREKYRNMIVSKNADGTFVKVPMPVEYNALGAFMVDSLEHLRDNNPEAFKGSADAITNAYTPPIVSGLAQGITQGGGIDKSMTGALNSTVIAPYAALQANKSFTGSPIEPMGMQGSPKYRYDERTSSVAKKLGEVLNYSPKKIDYVIRAYGGDPARLLLPLTSEQGGGEPRTALLKNFIADPVFTNTLATDFYETKEKITQAEDDFRDHQISLPTWYNEGLSKDFKSAAKGSYSKKLEQLSDEKKSINANKSVPRAERAELLRGVQTKMNEIYIEINSKAREMGLD